MGPTRPRDCPQSGVPFAEEEVSMFPENVGSISAQLSDQNRKKPSHGRTKNKQRLSTPIAATPQNAT